MKYLDISLKKKKKKKTKNQKFKRIKKRNTSMINTCTLLRKTKSKKKIKTVGPSCLASSERIKECITYLFQYLRFLMDQSTPNTT
jgi:ERCC4-type nuclease